MQSAERGTTSLHYVALARIYLSAECGATPTRVRSAKRGTRNGFAILRYANKDIIKNFLTDKNALVWMLAKAKVKPRRVAVLTYCALDMNPKS